MMSYRWKPFFLLSFFFIFFLPACEKEKLPSTEGSELSKERKTEDRGTREKVDGGGGPLELCTCSGFTFVEDDGGFACPPGEGCTKIVPCPCPNSAVNPTPSGSEAQEALASLDDAIANEEVEAFFQNGPWEAIFPFLQERENVLEELRSGDLSMLRLDPSKDGKVHYAAVEAPAEELSDVENTVLAIQVPTELYGTE